MFQAVTLQGGVRAGINTNKVIVGGLVAAVVFTVADAVFYEMFLKAEMDANMVRLGLDPAVAMSAAGMAMWIVSELVFGQLAVWTYAAMRPRFGPGPMTAVNAAVVPWVTVLLIYGAQTQAGMNPASFFWKGALCGAVSLVAGTIAGAAVYKES